KYGPARESQSEDGRRCQQPVPPSTVGTVRNRILKSSDNVQFSMYSMSSARAFSKDGSSRALVCQSPVIPGMTSRRPKCSRLYCSYSSVVGGLGPTRLISPFSTFQSCGSSSRLYLRRNLPTWVTRGSFLSLNRSPSRSLRLLRSALSWFVGRENRNLLDVIERGSPGQAIIIGHHLHPQVVSTRVLYDLVYQFLPPR